MKAKALLLTTMTPALGKVLGYELDRLQSITKQRQMPPEAAAMQLGTMLEELKMVPADIAISALRGWVHQEDKRKAMFFPAYAELIESFGYEFEERRLMLAACEGVS